jgi:hypothetical protein
LANLSLSLSLSLWVEIENRRHGEREKVVKRDKRAIRGVEG